MNRPSGCSISQAKISRHTHFLSRKMSIFRWKGLRPSPAHFCADFSQHLPVEMGVTRIIVNGVSCA
jgi:hypothetical protein